MIRWCLIVALSSVVSVVVAQEESVEDKLRRQVEAKLAKPFAQKVNWERSLKAASQRAQKEMKPVLGYFTMTDKPSPPSGRVEDEAFGEDWFGELSSRFVPYLNLTTGLPDEPDQGMFERKRGRLKPYIIFMNSRGVTLFEVFPFRGGLEDFKSRFSRDVDDACGIVTARARLAKKKSDKKARARLFLLESLRELKQPDPRGMAKSIKALKKKALDEDGPLVARAEHFLSHLPFYEIRDRYDKKIKEGRKNLNEGAMAAAQMEAAKSMYALYRKGQRVDDVAEDIYFDYWNWTTEGAIAVGDKASAQAAYQALLKGTGGRRAGAKLAELKRRIDAM